MQSRTIDLHASLSPHPSSQLAKIFSLGYPQKWSIQHQIIIVSQGNPSQSDLWALPKWAKLVRKREEVLACSVHTSSPAADQSIFTRNEQPPQIRITFKEEDQNGGWIPGSLQQAQGLSEEGEAQDLSDWAGNQWSSEEISQKISQVLIVYADWDRLSKLSRLLAVEFIRVIRPVLLMIYVWTLIAEELNQSTVHESYLKWVWV